MSYPTYLIHFNKNHSSKNGRFVSGDGDGDGVLDDHHNYSKNKVSNVSGGGSSSIDDSIGDQIDAAVRKFNHPEKITTYGPKKSNKKSSSKKKSGGSKSRRKSSSKKKAVKFKKEQMISALKEVTVAALDDKSLITESQLDAAEGLVEENSNLAIPFIEQLLGK